jgi:antitoxin PrlF
MITTVTSKGQATIPLEVRQHLGLEPGDKVDFVIEDDGAVRVRPVRYPTIASIRGFAGSLKRPLSKAEMLRIGREDALVTKYRRTR